MLGVEITNKFPQSLGTLLNIFFYFIKIKPELKAKLLLQYLTLGEGDHLTFERGQIKEVSHTLLKTWRHSRQLSTERDAGFISQFHSWCI